MSQFLLCPVRKPYLFNLFNLIIESSLIIDEIDESVRNCSIRL